MFAGLRSRCGQPSNENWGIMFVQEAARSCPPNPNLSRPPKSPEATGSAARLRVIGWFSMGMAVAALGIYVGSELRSRYKFKRRTPYDFYANAGEHQANEFGASEFGMGI